MRACLLAFLVACGGPPSKPAPTPSNTATPAPKQVVEPPPPSRCREACVHYFKLMFWDDAEQEIAAAPATDRDRLRRAYGEKFAIESDAGAGACAKQCESSGNTEQVACILNAITAVSVKACMGH